MGRPKPKVLAEITDRKTYRTEQVLAAEGIYAVFYDSAPVNLRSSNLLVQYPGPKYNPGHAINLARKLNAHFHTDKFTVVLMRQGETVFPDAKQK